MVDAERSGGRRPDDGAPQQDDDRGAGAGGRAADRAAGGPRSGAGRGGASSRTGAREGGGRESTGSSRPVRDGVGGRERPSGRRTDVGSGAAGRGRGAPVDERRRPASAGRGDAPARTSAGSWGRGPGRAPSSTQGSGDRGERPWERRGGAPGSDRGRGASGPRDDRGRDDRERGGGERSSRPSRPVEPALPEDVTGRELDQDVRRDLGALAADNATAVARHLVMVARLLDDDPARALEHGRAAQRRAGRVGAVREAAGLAAYRAGEYDEALRELRTARRLTGSQVHLPVMADCERGLGRPERALEAAAGPAARELDRAGQIELAMVLAGARGDLGQHDAAVLELQLPELTGSVPADLREAQQRLREAHEEALVAAGRRPARPDEAVEDEDDDVVLWEET